MVRKLRPPAGPCDLTQRFKLEGRVLTDCIAFRLNTQPGLVDRNEKYMLTAAFDFLLRPGNLSGCRPFGGLSSVLAGTGCNSPDCYNPVLPASVLPSLRAAKI